jgi:hypothetical protein
MLKKIQPHMPNSGYDGIGHYIYESGFHLHERQGLNTNAVRSLYPIAEYSISKDFGISSNGTDKITLFNR